MNADNLHKSYKAQTGLLPLYDDANPTPAYVLWLEEAYIQSLIVVESLAETYINIESQPKQLSDEEIESMIEEIYHKNSSMTEIAHRIGEFLRDHQPKQTELSDEDRDIAAIEWCKKHHPDMDDYQALTEAFEEGYVTRDRAGGGVDSLTEFKTWCETQSEELGQEAWNESDEEEKKRLMFYADNYSEPLTLIEDYLTHRNQQEKG